MKSSFPILASNPSSFPPEWVPRRTCYCVSCARILQPNDVLVCTNCARFEGLRIQFCNLCGAPLSPQNGASSAHDTCLRRRFALE